MPARRAVPIIVWGTSGHAAVVVDAIRQAGRFELRGAIDDVNRDRHGRVVLGVKVLGGREVLAAVHKRGVRHLVVAVGDNRARLELAGLAEKLGFVLPAIIHPRACLGAEVSEGGGAVVLAGAIVNPQTRIGRAVIVNTAASVDHDCVLGDGVHIAPGARLAGHVSVGNASLIGMGALIRDRVKVGHDCTIGMGAVVTRDMPDRATAYGNPARIVRPR